MDKDQETYETWNRVAKQYEEVFMDLDIYNESYDQFCEFIGRKDASILEIGCGPGNITRYLSKQQPSYKILVTDIAPNMIALAQKNVPSATFQLLDIRQLDTLEGYFHGIIIGFTLPYISKEETKKIFQDTYLKLHTNGTLYVSFVAGDDKDSGFITGSSGDRAYFYYHNIDDIKKVVSSQKFKIKRHLEASYKKKNDTTEIHTILILQK
ncbi:class I SAM-dependent methyltransferase [uncultured Dokdonia sp.]|uniref:class I SAM-dependent methyltransferase n=1 Tax=uncultured Dokdonia sp. TaxID=575653 RepID=UPI0026279E07|nr:class I SAM-dependent methyltransferase [uncultured Dokdonia sp.]